MSPGRWRWGTSSCLRRSGEPACPGLGSGRGWRNKTAGWRPGGPERGSAPWCSPSGSLGDPSRPYPPGSTCPVGFGFYFRTVLHLLLCRPLRVLLLPCYDGDDDDGRGRCLDDEGCTWDYQYFYLFFHFHFIVRLFFYYLSEPWNKYFDLNWWPLISERRNLQALFLLAGLAFS